jgi:multidrug resistance efflux pump
MVVGYTKVAAEHTPAQPAADPEEGVACFGHVDVKHGVTSLYPTQPGRVLEVPVEEGQIVEAGTVMLRLEETMARLRIQEARADLEAARSQLVEARKLPKQHEARLAQIAASIEAVRHRLAAAENVRDRAENLLAKNLTSKAERDVAQNQVKEAQAVLQAEIKKQTELGLRDPAADVSRAEEDVKARESRLGQAEEALKECTLRAPKAGKVMRILVGPGEMLGAMPKQPAILFCPDGERFIRAEVEQEFAYLLKIGQQATIRDDSKNPAVWRGRVTGVSDWFTNRRSILQEPLQLNDVRTLECQIAVDPDQPPLRLGQRVRVLIGCK